jgi:hypothetical protein
MLPIVTLNRRFIEWEKKEPPPDAEFRRAMGLEDGGLGWEELLSKRRVVILAEAGSGKSTEMKERARLQEADGRRAFHASLEDIGADGLEGALSATNRKRLAEWRESRDEAWLFLDSVDEAKAAGVRLEKVLRRLAEGILGAEHRAHVILSGRITDWAFRSDLELLKDWLPLPQSDPIAPEQELLQIVRQDQKRHQQPPQEEPLIVLMASLDRDRVGKFAEAKGAPKLAQFLEEIEAANLWPFARRPLDLDWLVRFWQSEGRLGSLAEMIDRGIAERLKETNPNRQKTDSLNETRALHGVERIAAAMVFGRRATIAIPDRDIAFSSDTPLELEDVLPDWSADERGLLLTRPIFDPATLGRARFHNDNEGVVRSYLTARWLLRLRGGNLLTGAVFDLLFASSYGVDVIRPSLAQTAAWLALWDQDVAREAVRRCSGLLFTAGDPASLPLEVRKGALVCVLRELATGNHESPMWENHKLRRFAQPDLGVAVVDLWEEYKDQQEAAELLLMLAWLGALKECSEIARQVALDSSRSPLARIFAGRILVRTCAEQTKQSYAKYVLAERSTLPPAMVRDAVDDIFPAFLGVADLLAVLETMGDTRDEGGLDLQWDGPKLVAKLHCVTDLEQLLRGLLNLLGGEIGTRDYHEPTEREEAYFPAIDSAVVRLLKMSPPGEAPEAAIDAVLRMGTRHHPGRDLADVRTELHRTLPRRRAAFWRAVERLRRPEEEFRRIENLWQMRRLGYWPDLRVEDIDWMLSEGLARSEYDRRLVINATLAIQQGAGSPDGFIEKIRLAASADAVASEAFESWMQAQQLPREAEDDAELVAAEALNAAAAHERDRSWIEFVEKLRADPARIAALRVPVPPPGSNTDLMYLCQLLEGAGNRSRYAVDTVTPLERLVGIEAATAARGGFIAHWRHNVPWLESHRTPEQRNTILYVDIMGIVGITLEAEANDHWAERLTSEEAKLAAGYATLELNGFPSWLSGLAKSKPTEVVDVLLGEIRAEFSSPEGSLHRTMGTVLHAGDELMTLLSPTLLDEIEAGTVPDGLLFKALQIVVRGMHTDRRTDFVKLGIERFEHDPTEPGAMLYLAAVFRLDPALATDALFRAKEGKEEGEQSALVNRFLMLTFGYGMSPPAFGADTIAVEVLDRLVQCVFHPGRLPASPKRPSGRAYSPTDGDRIDQAHSSLFNRFVNTPGPATYRALVNLQTQPCSITRTRLRALAEERAVKDSETAPWPASEVVSFERSGETAPSTSKDLQDLAVRVLADIQHELLNHDFAQGKTVKSLPLEKDVQLWVASALHQKRGRSFTVVREEHVVNEKEPDLRLRAKASDAMVAIEIKATRSEWTLKQLEEALVDQLCRRYLRAANGKHGILLLVHQDERKWKDVGTGIFLSSHDVVARLAAIAAEISSERSDSPQPVVCVLDVSAC